MDLQEDAYRLQQVLTNVSYGEIVHVLRKVPFSHTEFRCQVVLQHFLAKEYTADLSNASYEDNLRADVLCLKHLIQNISDVEIRKTLTFLGSIPNRKLVAAKLLLHKGIINNRKRKQSKAEETNEASSSKIVKIADSTDTIEPTKNDKEYSRIPKLILKRDRNANEFTVASPNKTGPQKPISQILRNTEEANDFQNDSTNEFYFNKHIPKVVTEECLPSSSTAIPDNIEAGPSGISTLKVAKPNFELDKLFETISNNLGMDDSVIDLSSTSDSLIIPEENEAMVPAIGTIVPATQQEGEATNQVIEPIVLATPEEDENILLPVDEKMVLKIMEMFPEALPNYIRKICAGKHWREQNEIIDIILTNENYPKRPERPFSPEKEVNPEEQLSMLMALLPDAHPTYLQEKVEQLAGDQDALRNFIEDAVDNKTYPTMKDYLREQQLSAQQRQYTKEFDVERFVKIFPDPVAVFEDPKRKTTILDSCDKYYVKWVMRNKYTQLYIKDVSSIIETQGAINVISIVKALDERCLSDGIKKKARCHAPVRPDSQNIPLLQELAYFEHKEEILKHLEAKKKQAIVERKDAKELGLLQTCYCCFDDEVMPLDILTCTGGCRFCSECIKRSTEVAFGEGKTNFPCFSGECDAEFSLPVLQAVLCPKLFSKLAQKKAVAEVKAAALEDLEMCPFCDFANIPAPGDKLFHCLNPDCMKESCRLCKEPSHVPLRCEEVEKDEAVKARTYIENKMTEALVRECWRCGAKFIKEEGCNKMTCSCGATMCYICRQPVKDYKHFNGQGGDRLDLCPLYTDNFSVNEKNVIKAAEKAKKEVDPTQLKNDPTADLQMHFEEVKKARLRAHQALPGNPAIINARLMMNNFEVVRLRQDLHAFENHRRYRQQGHIPPPPQPAVNPDHNMHNHPGVVMHEHQQAGPNPM